MQAPNKTCPYCKKSKCHDEDNFVKKSNGTLGPCCKDCAKSWREAQKRALAIKTLNAGM